ncbi:FecR domain-containing protein [Nodosilinea sp. LEGE 06152]|uniref:FecR family protein n=1 Tax=Nodosilinea sp. LEGE 06152 TaxID=2777966 RepID=UPI00187EEC9B|nr:FecR family protein [Nodosilinea sp. LEGE 06152]MBE9159029.1 FecR domain-containing protein [Nodosilinea sp. LEGE 06152]
MRPVSREIALALRGRAETIAQGRSLAMALVIAGGIALGGCEQATPPATTVEPQGEASAIAPESQSTAIATIQAIVANPVSVTLGQGEPEPAQVNQAMAYGDQIRTADRALAEVGLVTGARFRIGGNAALTLQPSQLQLSAGQMITWVEGTLPEPVDIVTPAGIAGIRGTTVFVNIDDDPNAPVEIFSWEGEVAFRLADGGEEVVLTSGEQLFVSPGEQDIDALRQQVQPLDRATAQQRLEASPLINGFDQPLPTRSQIEATVDALQ